MKKKLIALACAVSMAMALPALAWADEAAGVTGEAPTTPTKQKLSAQVDGMTLSAEATAAEMTLEGGSDQSSFHLVLKDARTGIIFNLALSDKYNDCDKVKVSVQPNGESQGTAKQFELKRIEGESTILFASNLFGVYDIFGAGVYQGDFTITCVPVKAEAAPADPPAADKPADSTDKPSEAPKGIDTSSKSPKTGLGLGAVAAASAGMLMAAGATALVLRKRLAK